MHYISCLLVAAVALGKIVTVGKKGSKKKEKEQHAGKKDKYTADSRELAMRGAELHGVNVGAWTSRRQHDRLQGSIL